MQRFGGKKKVDSEIEEIEIELKLAQQNKTQQPTNQQQTAYTRPEKTRVIPVYDKYQHSSPSLKDLGKKSPEQKQAAPTQKIEERPKVVEDFSQEELKLKWLRFAEDIQSEMPRLYQILKNHIPQKGNNYVLNLELDNTGQKQDFEEKLLTRIQVYLKKTLENDAIQFNVEVASNENSQGLVFGNKEKYLKLMQINPALNKLKDDFDLEFE